VVCLVELKARFDEQRNIYWAQRLERAGVQVVYGVLGLKTHTKLALVVRHESDGLCCYVHVGTGNYNAQTAALYTDLGLFTCNARITSEAVDLFNYLTGRSLKKNYRTLLVAPMTMRATFMDLIQREIDHQAAGRPARIVAKMNQLADREMTRALYAASQAGVGIDLLVRGFCCLRPGVKGMSEHIRVTSVIGRFLEHSRIFYFRDGAKRPEDGRLYIGSADWMYRNLSRRVEVVAPIEDPAGRATLLRILDVMQQDRRHAWDLQPDGTYVQRQPLSPSQRGTHVALMQHAMQHATGFGERVQLLAEPEPEPAP
jgi:polyphosphate kinase